MGMATLPCSFPTSRKARRCAGNSSCWQRPKFPPFKHHEGLGSRVRGTPEKHRDTEENIAETRTCGVWRYNRYRTNYFNPESNCCQTDFHLLDLAAAGSEMR